MPSTVDGIGSKYCGKKNEHTYQGTCEFCGAHTHISSYDTTKFFVFLYVPIFPLGEKRVLSECGSCGKHKVLKLSEWERMKKESAEELYDSWFRNLGDTEKLKELLELMVYSGDIELLNSLDRDIRNNCINNPEVMNLLGETHFSFNQLDEAESAFEASLSLKEDVEVSEKLAEVLARNRKPDKARYLLSHIFDNREEDKLYYVFLLIESYQFIGEHNNALEVIEKLEKAFPEMEDDKALIKYKKNSMHYSSSDKSITGKLISENLDKKDNKNLSFILPKVMLPLLVAALILIYSGISFLIGMSRSVHVVNGLDVSYSIEIDGEEIELPAMDTKKINVSEGTTKVNILDSDIGEGEFELDINTPFWHRPFKRRLYILNPDKVAVLLWEETEYSVNDPGDIFHDMPYKYYTGEYFYEMETVDFLFKEFPETTTIRSRKEKRTRLEHVKDSYSIMDYMNIFQELDYENILSHIGSKLLYNPDDERSLQLLTYYFDKYSCIEFFEDRLDVRPILVNLHITYQDYMEMHEPTHDLKSQYTDYLENEKDNKDLYFLLSRVEDDFEKREHLLKQSIEGSSPSAFGYYGLALRNQAMGNFEEAYEYIKKALSLRANQEEFIYLMENSMLSLSMYDDLLQRKRMFQQREPYNSELVFEEVILCMSKGDVGGARDAVSRYLSRISKFGIHAIQTQEEYLHGVIAYCSGDVEYYVNSIEVLKADDPILAYESAFIRGDYDEAADIALNNWLGSYYLLLLYLSEDNPEVASEYLNLAIEAYQDEGTIGKNVADYLSGTKDWSVEDAKSLVVNPSHKLLVLLALGKMEPDYKGELFEFAKKFNYDRDFPYHFIEDLIKVELS
ncbi:hypothetical protein RBH29_00820 [Herbivorax sp. ANBcel31]|uniref:tetratricopeptide repeat protein n=1 Tax=Herbivorax sp. ANBcel31 TaxID=3069754 RepID=UPI0027B79E2F|nr:hypothetical protein [Herbivorax sp. ANBcel31]MDQ2084979.1 hypothetical protein [Herbivorax sp. ANBcel31]